MGNVMNQILSSNSNGKSLILIGSDADISTFTCCQLLQAKTFYQQFGDRNVLSDNVCIKTLYDSGNIHPDRLMLVITPDKIYCTDFLWILTSFANQIEQYYNDNEKHVCELVFDMFGPDEDQQIKVEPSSMWMVLKMIHENKNNPDFWKVPVTLTQKLAAWADEYAPNMSNFVRQCFSMCKVVTANTMGACCLNIARLEVSVIVALVSYTLLSAIQKQFVVPSVLDEAYVQSWLNDYEPKITSLLNDSNWSRAYTTFMKLMIDYFSEKNDEVNVFQQSQKLPKPIVVPMMSAFIDDDEKAGAVWHEEDGDYDDVKDGDVIRPLSHDDDINPFDDDGNAADQVQYHSASSASSSSLRQRSQPVHDHDNHSYDEDDMW